MKFPTRQTTPSGLPGIHGTARVDRRTNAVVRRARPGDIAVSYADPSLAERELGWRTTRSVQDMCADTWRWQQANPEGYPG